jgi:phage portal protein BeeE
MNLFSPILRLFNSRSLSNPDTGYQIGALERTTTESGVTVSDERALKVSAVWACVQLISNSVASMPISVFRDTDSGRSPLNSKHYLTDLLAQATESVHETARFQACDDGANGALEQRLCGNRL